MHHLSFQVTQRSHNQQPQDHAAGAESCLPCLRQPCAQVSTHSITIILQEGLRKAGNAVLVLLPPLNPWGQLSTAGVTELLTPWAGRVAEGAWVGVTCTAETAERCTQPPVGS